MHLAACYAVLRCSCLDCQWRPQPASCACPAALQELLEVEPEAKWPLLTLVRLKELRAQVLRSDAASSASGATGSAASERSQAAAAAAAGQATAAAAAAATEAEAEAEGLAAEVAAGYARLIELDPLRRGYYEDALAGRAHVVARPQAAAATPL